MKDENIILEMNEERRRKIHKILDLCLDLNSYTDYLKEDGHPKTFFYFNGETCGVSAEYYRRGKMDFEGHIRHQANIDYWVRARAYDKDLDNCIKELKQALLEQMEEAE